MTRGRLPIFLAWWLLTAGCIEAANSDGLVRDALAAEARLDSRRALELFLEADKARPGDATILQKIAQQYSDLIVELRDEAERKRYAETALGYAERAVALDPKNAVNVLSLAVCHGKLGVLSDNRAKVRHSRLVKEEAERALTLDPGYAWAHHVLGRWHHEVASLGATTKFFVGIVYGGLPDASAKRAVEHLTQAVRLEPDELAHHLELGFAYAASGAKEMARSTLAKGLSMASRKKHDESAKTRARTELEKLTRG